MDETGSKTLYLERWASRLCASSDPDDRLGQLSSAARDPSQDATEAASAAADANRRIGAVLVQMKAIRAPGSDLGRHRAGPPDGGGLFQWTRAITAFSEGSLPSDEVITLKMHTGDLTS